jgi:hypothetical protein
MVFVLREQVARKDILESAATGKKETVREDSLVSISMSSPTSTTRRNHQSLLLKKGGFSY